MKPILLISIDNGVFSITEEAKSFLEQIESPIGVISIAGLYRTGKSFILNQLIGEKNGYYLIYVFI
jgi:hypothetical protein